MLFFLYLEAYLVQQMDSGCNEFVACKNHLLEVNPSVCTASCTDVNFCWKFTFHHLPDPYIESTTLWAKVSTRDCDPMQSSSNVG